MIDPIQNPNISHRLNQAHISKKLQDKKISEDQFETDRDKALQSLSNSEKWWRVAQAAILEKMGHKAPELISEDNRTLSTLRAMVQSKESIRRMVAVVTQRILRLQLQDQETAYKKADALIAPFCPPINLQKFRRQFYLSYLKAQKDSALGNWVAQAQLGDKTTYRQLLYHLKLVLTDFFNRHYHGQFDAPVVIDEILIVVDKALPTYDGKSSFFSWFFALVKAKLLTLNVSGRSQKPLKDRHAAVAEHWLAQLSIQYPGDAKP